MCACNGTGVIRNDIGMGMYQVVGCSCAAGERRQREADKNRQEVMKRLEMAYQMQMQAKLGVGA
ncbi:hypothetical protein COL60_16435 [Bacillus pseudomycoides]|nr:hypothetical protein COL60_16435 [Bacillus pseudomycoides]PFZ09843.1 hypothetical protein COL63_21145 [Bacillus pseudomycoides]